jgi:Mg/Co/Ni transporter MgtE
MIGYSLNAADELLDLWPTLPRAQQVDRFEALPRELMDNFFLGLDARAQSSLLLSLPEGERRLCMRLVAPDEAADIIQETPKQTQQHLLELLDHKTKTISRTFKLKRNSQRTPKTSAHVAVSSRRLRH